MTKNKINILFIVEGEKTENNFFNNLAKNMDVSFDIFCVKTNIYKLYKKMKENDFNISIKDVLLDLDINNEDKEKLNHNFAYTYLIFDFDVHHRDIIDKQKPYYDLVKDNEEDLQEMINYFIDETDDTIGKLYINYPMMESYQDCCDFFDSDYKNKIIPIEESKNYKTIVSNRSRILRFHLDKYNISDFLNLALMNVYKLNYIITNKWSKPNYNEYSRISNQLKLFNSEVDLIDKYKIISVINTSTMIILDYYGNKNNYYDKLSEKI